MDNLSRTISAELSIPCCGHCTASHHFTLTIDFSGSWDAEHGIRVMLEPSWREDDIHLENEKALTADELVQRVSAYGQSVEFQIKTLVDLAQLIVRKQPAS